MEIFQELDHYEQVAMKESENIQKIYWTPDSAIFFASLNSEFEQVRGEILCKDHIPPLEEAYAHIRRDALH